MVAERRRRPRSRGSGSTAAAGTRRSGRRSRSPTSKGFPLHDALSKVSPNNPVLLTHASGHASFANAKAMELSGVTGKTTNPAGGDFIKDAKGNPTGLFRETASRLIRRGAGEPPRTPDEERSPRRARCSSSRPPRSSPKASRRSRTPARRSTTSICIKAMIDEGKMNVRLWMMLRMGNQSLAAEPREVQDHRLRPTASSPCARSSTRSTARSARAAPGCSSPTRTSPATPAATPTPVDDDHARPPRSRMQHGYQLCVHAIGDRANRETLEHLRGGIQGESRQARTCAGASSTRSTCMPADIPRFGKLGVIASMQGIHCTSDAPYVLARLGPQARRGRRLRVAEADEVRRHRSPTAPTRRSRTSIRSRATTRPSAAS